MQLHEKLKQTRKDNALTISFVANSLGLNERTITRYESGAILPPLDKLEKLSKLYNTPLPYFISNSTDKNSSVFQYLDSLSKQELAAVQDYITHLQEK